MGITVYRAVDEFDGARFSSESLISMEDARRDNYVRAYKSGYWTPPKLREKPWQFWRPVEHSEFVLDVLQASQVDQ